MFIGLRVSSFHLTQVSQTKRKQLPTVTGQPYCCTVPAKFDYGDRSPETLIAKLKISEFAKDILIKLIDEFGPDWHQKLYDVQDQSDLKWEIDPDLIDLKNGMAKENLSTEQQLVINTALKNSLRPFMRYEYFLDSIEELLSDKSSDEEDEEWIQKFDSSLLLKEWRNERISYWESIKGFGGKEARNQTYLDLEKIDLGGKSCTCHTCGVFFYDNIPDLFHHAGVKELYCSVSCESKASFECIVCGEEYVVGHPHASLFDTLRILRLQSICSHECLPIYKTEKLLQSRYVSGARRRALKYGVDFDETINRESVFKSELGKCYLCQIETHLEHISEGYEPRLATVDHVMPISKGGPHTWGNVRNCCLKCNITKHDRIY